LVMSEEVRVGRVAVAAMGAPCYEKNLS